MKVSKSMFAVLALTLATAWAARAHAAAPQEINFVKVTGSITHDSDPQSDQECQSPAACDSFKLTASFTIPDNVDLISDISNGDMSIEFGVTNSANCFNLSNFFGELIPTVATSTTGHKTKATFSGMVTLFRGNGPRAIVPLSFSLTIDTVKNTGVLRASGGGDFTSMLGSPVSFAFLYNQNEKSDGDLDEACISFPAKMKNAP